MKRKGEREGERGQRDWLQAVSRLVLTEGSRFQGLSPGCRHTGVNDSELYGGISGTVTNRLCETPNYSKV